MLDAARWTLGRVPRGPKRQLLRSMGIFYAVDENFFVSTTMAARLLIGFRSAGHIRYIHGEGEGEA